MEIIGKLIQILPDVQGESARGPWLRGGFVIETDDGFPRKVAFTAFGEERVAMAKNIPLGQSVLVTFTPESREFNEKWYTDLRASRVQPYAPGAAPVGAAQPYAWAGQPAAAPAPAAQPAPAQPAPAAPQMPQASEDDLPF